VPKLRLADRCDDGAKPASTEGGGAAATAARLQMAITLRIADSLVSLRGIAELCAGARFF